MNEIRSAFLGIGGVPAVWKNRQIRAIRSGLVSGDVALFGMSVPETIRVRGKSTRS
ncbi:MAG: hypothetical protein AB7N70_15825 [Dehalococcoidia bacterium]